jgi:predicted enzyme involved in methoxymalonyl-ACP biosynthesis
MEYYTIAKIDSFMISCRVMGRAIEDQVIADVAKHYINRGFTRIEASFIPTGKNKPVEWLYDRLGFEVVTHSKEQTEYVLNLEKELTGG